MDLSILTSLRYLKNITYKTKEIQIIIFLRLKLRFEYSFVLKKIYSRTAGAILREINCCVLENME